MAFLHPKISLSHLLQSATEKPCVVPVGLNFGPTWLSISFFIDQSEYYTGVPCDAVYQSFFEDNLSREVQCNLEHRPSECFSTSATSSVTTQEKATELVDRLSRDIRSAVQMGVSALDYNRALKFKVKAVTVPDHWDVSAHTQVATALKVAGHPLDGSHMFIPLSRAIQSAYQTNRYTEGDYLTLLVDYNKSYLHLILAQMCRTSCTTKGQVYFPQLGEDELHKIPTSSSADSVAAPSLDHQFSEGKPSGVVQINNKSITNVSIGDIFCRTPPTTKPSTGAQPVSEHPISDLAATDNTRTDGFASVTPKGENATVPDEFSTHRPVCHNQAAHFKPIVDAICEFMVLMTIPEAPIRAENSPMPKYTVGEVRHAVREVKNIVINGEASIHGLRDLRDAVKEKFINQEWISVQGEKADCGAYGAAVAARCQLQNPKRLGDWKDLPEYISGRVA